jgi:NAD(P)-dependent dehydrogenase (short-subunit alcohol dehydrogenase family)
VELKDKVALVTGGNRGIGNAIAKRFARDGARVAITARRKADADKAAVDVPCLGLVADVTDSASLDRAVAKVVDELGGIDILVNNAGIYPASMPMHQVSDEAWCSVIDTNLNGTFYASRPVIKQMVERDTGGCIINIASVSGLRPSEDVGADAYGASKAAVIFLTKMWALEYAKFNIRVNAICPGLVDTDMAAPFMADESARTHEIGSHPLGRIGTVQDVVAAVSFLVSPQSSWTTGAILSVDGGIAAK